jgi:hypothetical protein
MRSRLIPIMAAAGGLETVDRELIAGILTAEG